MRPFGLAALWICVAALAPAQGNPPPRETLIKAGRLIDGRSDAPQAKKPTKSLESPVEDEDDDGRVPADGFDADRPTTWCARLSHSRTTNALPFASDRRASTATVATR